MEALYSCKTLVPAYQTAWPSSRVCEYSLWDSVESSHFYEQGQNIKCISGAVMPDCGKVLHYGCENTGHGSWLSHTLIVAAQCMWILDLSLQARWSAKKVEPWCVVYLILPVFSWNPYHPNTSKTQAQKTWCEVKQQSYFDNEGRNKVYAWWKTHFFFVLPTLYYEVSRNRLPVFHDLQRCKEAMCWCRAWTPSHYIYSFWRPWSDLISI
jgi:hypothetical protein